MSQDGGATVFDLPASLIGRPDLSRLIREVEVVGNDLEAQKVRTESGEVVRQLAVSQALEDFLNQNKLETTDGQAMMTLKEQLEELKEHSPVIHMTFAGPAEPAFLQEIVTWLRREVHPHTLVSVGVQPSLVGGAYVRTPNRVHDFSIKSLLQGKREIIVHELEGRG